MGNNPNKLIGLIGAAGVGKTTLANKLGLYGYEHLSFGKGIKDMMRGFLKGRVPDTYIEDIVVGSMKDQNLHVLAGLTSRDVQIVIGQGMRQKYAEFWVDDFVEQMQKVIQYRPCVVDDIRQINEAHAVTSHGGHLIELTGERYVVDDLAYIGDDLRLQGYRIHKWHVDRLDGNGYANFRKFVEKL